jgi:N-glycosylase/DNA lyase
LASHGHRLEIPQKSPHWSELKKFFRQLGVEIETEEVERVRDLRHFLTHRRGELRTDDQRNRYAKDCEEPWAIYVPLTEEQVLAVMDELVATVRTIDPAVYRHAWGREVVESLLRQS